MKKRSNILTAVMLKTYQYFPDAAKDFHYFFEELSSRLLSEIDINKTNMGYKASKKFFNLCRTPEILDYVEDILGPNFAQWGSIFS